MPYKDVYNMAVEDLMNMWNEFCLEHDREKLIVYTMADWRREVDYRHNITWLLDRLDTERFNPNHEYVAFDTCDDVWVSSDDIFDLVDVCLMIDETQVYNFEDLSPKAKKKAINNHRLINVDKTNWLDVTRSNYMALFPPEFKLSETDTLRTAVEEEIKEYTEYVNNEFEYYISDDAVALVIKDMEFYKDGSDL